jgi:hypothetical protein
MFSKIGAIVIVLLCLIKAGNHKGISGVVEVLLASIAPVYLIWIAPHAQWAAQEWVKRYGWKPGIPHPYGLQVAFKTISWLLLVGIFSFVYVF